MSIGRTPTGPLPRHIILVGSMGVGKTTVGRALSTELEFPFLDSDSEIEREHGATAADIAASKGVPELHEMELAVFLDMTRSTTMSVIAPAASVIDRARAREVLRQHLTIWLHAPQDVVDERRAAGEHRRPVGEHEQARLLAQRTRLWTEVARIEVDTSGSVSSVVAELVRRLESRESPQ